MSIHAKYEVSISYGSKFIANVKVDNRQPNRQTDKQTGQKQYAPDHSIRGHKNRKESPGSRDNDVGNLFAGIKKGGFILGASGTM